MKRAAESSRMGVEREELRSEHISGSGNQSEHRASQAVRWQRSRRPTQEMQGQSLGQGHPLDKGLAARSSAPAREVSRTEETGVLQSMGSQGQTRLSD